MKHFCCILTFASKCNKRRACSVFPCNCNSWYVHSLSSFLCRRWCHCWKRAWCDFCARVCRSFTTTHGALTPVSHVTATRWVPSHGPVTQSLASASAGLALLVASATHATTHLLRSQIPAVRVRRLFTITMAAHLVLWHLKFVFISGNVCCSSTCTYWYMRMIWKYGKEFAKEKKWWASDLNS